MLLRLACVVSVMRLVRTGFDGSKSVLLAVSVFRSSQVSEITVTVFGNGSGRLSRVFWSGSDGKVKVSTGSTQEFQEVVVLIGQRVFVSVWLWLVWFGHCSVMALPRQKASIWGVAKEQVGCKM